MIIQEVMSMKDRFQEAMIVMTVQPHHLEGLQNILQHTEEEAEVLHLQGKS